MSNNQNIARTEFAAAIIQIANDRKIDPASIYEAIRQALVTAYKKQIGSLDENYHYYSILNEVSGESKIFKAPVLKKDEETEEITDSDLEKLAESLSSEEKEYLPYESEEREEVEE